MTVAALITQNLKVAAKYLITNGLDPKRYITQDATHLGVFEKALIRLETYSPVP